MNGNQSDEIWERLRSEALPSCPSDLEDRVLRRIRHEAAGQDARVDPWTRTLTVFMQPRMAAILLVFTAFTAVTTTAVASQFAQPKVVKADTLGLECLSDTDLFSCFHTTRPHH